jgi:hypothetical protein
LPLKTESTVQDYGDSAKRLCAWLSGRLPPRSDHYVEQGVNPPTQIQRKGSRTRRRTVFGTLKYHRQRFRLHMMGDLEHGHNIVARLELCMETAKGEVRDREA